VRKGFAPVPVGGWTGKRKKHVVQGVQIKGYGCTGQPRVAGQVCGGKSGAVRFRTRKATRFLQKRGGRATWREGPWGVVPSKGAA